jgi:hypothetical protein
LGQFNMTNTIDRAALTRAAFTILVDDLHGYKNVLSGPHAGALLSLVDLFTSYCTGEIQGRKAFPLPTGMGKTSAVLAFITALSRLGYRVPVSVAVSRVEALCKLKRELMGRGVPEADIGLAHHDPRAAEPSTGCRPEDGRLFQLVTHARVRMGESYFALFGTYRDKPRPLCIYDETLFRSSTFAFAVDAVESALGALRPDAKRLQELRAPVDYLQRAVDIVNEALKTAQSASDPLNRGIPIELPEERNYEVFANWKDAIARARFLSPPQADILCRLLDVSQEPLQVLPLAQGGGAVAVRQAVSDMLANVVILDASTPIRDLVSMDPTIAVAGSPNVSRIKSFENVEVCQLAASGGRSSIEKTITQEAKEVSSLGREVAAIIARELQDDPARCFLVFSFKRSSRKAVDVIERLREDLHALGLNPDAMEGNRQKFNFLTWGMHEGLNGYEFCQTVILAGVLHQAQLDIAAAIRGQAADLAAATPHALVTRVLKSEIGHCVYQAASRGSCRRVTMGKANPMRLHLVHSDLGLRESLDPVMPGARWTYPEPRFLKKAAAAGRPILLRGQILEALRGLPEGTQKVSTRALKAMLGLPRDEATKSAFTDAVNRLNLPEHNWVLEGRSLVSGAVAYGFAS